MKKLTILLIVILLGIFLLNAIQMQITAKEQTIGYVFGILNDNLQKMTSAEKELLYSRCGEKDISDATVLIGLWGALLRVSTESINIMKER